MSSQPELPATPFHHRFLTLVAEIERSLPVAQWKSGDLELWPLARMDLYLDLYWVNVGGAAPKRRSLPLRVLGSAATPVTNVWKSRRDLRHWVGRPNSADVIFLGDGVSLDLVDGAWQDRYGEPIIAALETQGLSTFLMQSGGFTRLPWHRRTFAANLIAARGSLARFAHQRRADLPGHEEVLRFLAASGVSAPSLSRKTLEGRASVVCATAAAFERVLLAVNPKLAFVVTYYAGLGPAFLLACRRRGILSVDIQHCPQDGAHKAYGWEALPGKGYATLPAVFWNWTARDAADIRRWTTTLSRPWHRSLHGGHTQLSSILNAGPAGKVWDARFAAVAKGTVFEREVLVVLQPVGGFRAAWDSLARQIEAAPATWRWWIRRHPASAPYQDVEYMRLIALRGANVMVEESSSLPLPILLRHMSVVVSRFSGAAVEGVFLGVPAIFISEEARDQYSDLIDRGFASIVPVAQLVEVIATMPAASARPTTLSFPDLNATLLQLREFALDYARLCHGESTASSFENGSHS
jgi:hypothetical protein